jgi:hypothetical protein
MGSFGGGPGEYSLVNSVQGQKPQSGAACSPRSSRIWRFKAASSIACLLGSAAIAIRAPGGKHLSETGTAASRASWSSSKARKRTRATAAMTSSPAAVRRAAVRPKSSRSVDLCCGVRRDSGESAGFRHVSNGLRGHGVDYIASEVR